MYKSDEALALCALGDLVSERDQGTTCLGLYEQAVAIYSAESERGRDEPSFVQGETDAL